MYYIFLNNLCIIYSLKMSLVRYSHKAIAHYTQGQIN